MNILFEYLYRDAGNNKNWGSVIFSNREGLSVEELTLKIRSGLIDGEFFEVDKLGVPPLYFDRYDPELDHGWHEFFGIEETGEGVRDSHGRDIAELIRRRHRGQSPSFYG